MNRNPKPHLVKHRIKKGEVKNPEGGRAHNSLKRKIRKLTLEELEEVYTFLLSATDEQVTQLINDPASNQLTKGILMSIRWQRGRGSIETIQYLVERVVGKTPDRIQAETRVLVDEMKRLELLDNKELIKNAEAAIELFREDGLFQKKVENSE